MFTSTAVFNVHSGERVSFGLNFIPSNCTAKYREVILFMYVDPFEKLCAKYEIGKRKKVIREILLVIGFIFRKKAPHP